MKKVLCLFVLAPFALIGCADEPTTYTTTTTTQEVTTTGPAGVIAPTGSVIVRREPPAVRVETQTVSPGPGYVWTGGYWRWSGNNYVWMPGSWLMPPRRAAVWVPGHWVNRGGGWVWIAGHWG
jgi:hypothetical protein